MTCKILQTCEKYGLLKKGETVAVGVSGGADSVCLLHFLSKIRDEYDIVVKAIHVNHNIRGEEAKHDENYVRAICKKLDVEFICFSVDIPKLRKELSMSEEECARKIRYECFEKVGADKIATAHTLSDSAETVIFNLARGTGLKGMTGISPKRGKIIRPLIELTRADTELYCKENGLDFVTDSTNLCDDYTRNKLRHNVVPVLKEVNESFEKSILRFTETARAEDDFLSSCAEELLQKAKTENGFSRDIFISSHEAVSKRAVAKLLFEKMKKDTEFRHIELCLDIIKKGKGSVEISKNLYFTVKDDLIFFTEAENSEELFWQVKAGLGKTETPFGNFETELCEADQTLKSDIYFTVDADNINTDSLYLRSRKVGDEITSIKRKNTKTLKKLFIESKIPKNERHKLAVLVSENEILWVENFGTNAKFVPKKETKRVLLIKKLKQRKESSSLNSALRGKENV